MFPFIFCFCPRLLFPSPVFPIVLLSRYQDTVLLSRSHRYLHFSSCTLVTLNPLLSLCPYVFQYLNCSIFPLYSPVWILIVYTPSRSRAKPLSPTPAFLSLPKLSVLSSEIGTPVLVNEGATHMLKPSPYPTPIHSTPVICLLKKDWENMYIFQSINFYYTHTTQYQLKTRL